MPKFYGSTVGDDGQVRFMSVSQIGRANPKEDGGCVRKWWFRYSMGFPEPERTGTNKGTEGHSQVEHYLKTGEIVLGREAKPLQAALPVPRVVHQPTGQTYLIEHGLNDKPKEPGEFMHDPAETLLHCAGVPIVGFMDLVIPPELAKTSIIQLDDESFVSVENPPNTIEIVDNKFYKDPDKYAKSEDQLRELSQQVGYGEWGLVKYPDTEWVRLSLAYARTDVRRKPKAKKVSVLVPADEIHEKWDGYFTSVVERVKSVASVVEEEEDSVPANTNACNDYGGCAYRGRCKAFNQQTPLARIQSSLTGGIMANMFSKSTSNGATGATVAAPPPPPPASALPPPPTNGAAIPLPSSAKGVAAPPAPAPAIVTPTPPSAPGPMGVAITAAQAEQQKNYILPDGRMATFLCMTGGKFSFLPINESGTPIDKPALLDGTLPVVTIAAAAAATAPAAAAPTPTPAPTPAAAAPPPPAPTAAAATPPPPPAAGAAPAASAPAAARGPGRPRKAPAAGAAEAASAAPTAAVAPSAAYQGDWLFIDCAPYTPHRQLDSYIWEAVHMLAHEHNLIDIRFPPDDKHPMAFGKWKGALAALFRAQPPKGVNVVRSGTEFSDLAIETLAPLFGERVVRATR